jgi:dTDP-glucose 4,6-dehydratase
MKIIITGGCGFIGSHVIRLFVTNYPQYYIINLDSLTYAGNPDNLSDIQHLPNYTFVKGDITDETFINTLFSEHQPDAVIHLAAESHVDRSIMDPLAFVKTNILGTAILLNAAKGIWKNQENKLFYHVSTDEVYGSLGETGFFTEETPYDPRSPYSASKASSDMLVRAYHHTYHLPVVLSNCSNNFFISIFCCFVSIRPLSVALARFNISFFNAARLFDENNNSSTRFNTDNLILSNKLCEIGDKIGFASSGTDNGVSIQRNKKLRYAFSIS